MHIHSLHKFVKSTSMLTFICVYARMYMCVYIYMCVRIATFCSGPDMESKGLLAQPGKVPFERRPNHEQTGAIAAYVGSNVARAWIPLSQGCATKDFDRTCPYVDPC